MFEGGKHVLSEKPMTLNGKQAKEMITAAAGNRRLLAEGHWVRHHVTLTSLNLDIT